jgi:hypothetical protein
MHICIAVMSHRYGAEVLSFLSSKSLTGLCPIVLLMPVDLGPSAAAILSGHPIFDLNQIASFCIILHSPIMSLPDFFCWTRFGTEAGQSIELIFARKEQERIANAGVFFWGIGNAIGPSLLELLRRSTSPEAVFSPIQSAPRREDAMPSSVVAWTQAETLAGQEYRLPEHSLITSRFDPLKPKIRHYALVCYSETQISIGLPSEQVRFGELRNLLTNRPLGSSQVTAVVHKTTDTSHLKSTPYDVAFRAQLAPPYFVLLRRPVPLAHSETGDHWAEIVRKASDCRRQVGDHPSNPLS